MPDDLVVRIRGGARIHVPAALGNITTFVLLEQESWFEDEFAFAGTCVAPGETAVDVGANFGVYTTALARSAGPDGRVIAFEPAAATAARLRQTLADEPHPAELRQQAVSDHGGEALLQIGASPELNALTESSAAGQATERVELTTLDAALSEVERVDFLKIDAEGHELPVLRGAQRVLRHCEPLVMFEISHDDSHDRPLLDQLADLGFDVFRLVPGLGVLAPLAPSQPMDAALLNLFACRPGLAQRLAESGLLVREPAITIAAPALDDDAAGYLEALPGAPGAAAARGVYAQVLQHVAALQTASLDPAEELAHLTRAHGLSAQALQEKRSAARILTHARVCADLGQRESAVGALTPLVEQIYAGARPVLDEPCIPPVARHAALDWDSDPSAWVQRAAVEAFIRLSAFSSVYAEPTAFAALLEFLRQRPWGCAEMERRRQLLRMVRGQQARPESHPLLVREAPDNLNPWFWSRDA